MRRGGVSRPRTCGKAGHGGFLKGGAPRLSQLRDPLLPPQRPTRRRRREPRTGPVSGALLPPFPSSGPGGRGAGGSAAAGASRLARTWGRGFPSRCAVGGALTPRLQGELREVILSARRLARGGRPRAFLLPFKVRRGGNGAGFYLLPLVAVPASTRLLQPGGGAVARGRRHEWVPG